MNFLDAVRTLRKERGLNYQDARDEVVKYFRKKGLPIPYVFQTAEERKESYEKKQVVSENH